MYGGLNMELSVGRRNVGRAGWSTQEDEKLWSAVSQAQEDKLPLRQVFERVAFETGRKPNSIRNYYYAQMRERSGEECARPRFVAFEQEEMTQLLRDVFMCRAQGMSVRASVAQLAEGDRVLMLRYQNKYRSLIKNRPDLVEQVLREMEAQGVSCMDPRAQSRPRRAPLQMEQPDYEDAPGYADPDLVQMLSTINRLVRNATARPTELIVERDKLSVRNDLLRLELADRQAHAERLADACESMLACVKQFMGMESTRRTQEIDGFCGQMIEHASMVENAMTFSAGITHIG